jgi:hypothetical protein
VPLVPVPGTSRCLGDMPRPNAGLLHEVRGQLQKVRVRRDKPPELDTIIGPARQHHPYSA